MAGRSLPPEEALPAQPVSSVSSKALHAVKEETLLNRISCFLL